MKPRTRLAMFLLAAPGLAALLIWGMLGLPSFGAFHGAYAVLVAHLSVPQREATDPITAVNFDYRALDTLGEEFILFTAVIGVAVLLREQRDERERPSARSRSPHRFEGSSFALRALTLALLAPGMALALYIDSHGAISPGGGFQGGVIGSATLIMVFLGGGYLAMKHVSPHVAVEAAEASGAAGYALVGVGGLIFATVFFHNFLGYGESGKLISAGTMPLSSLAVALEVTGAFVLVWSELLDQALVVRSG